MRWTVFKLRMFSDTGVSGAPEAMFPMEPFMFNSPQQMGQVQVSKYIIGRKSRVCIGGKKSFSVMDELFVGAFPKVSGLGPKTLAYLSGIL